MGYVVSSRLVQKLTNLEGFRELPYKDGGGLWTIGYGRRCQKYTPKTTRESEIHWMEARLADICKSLDGLFPGWVLTGTQVDALCSFIYNIGIDGFKSSDTYKLLKAHNYKAFEHWDKWIKDAAGKVEAGLVTRRAWEINLFVFSSY